MAKLPIIKSPEQILGDMLSSYMSKMAVNDLNTGSAILSLFEAVTQAIYRSTGDTLSILRDSSVDRAEGESLKKIAADERVRPIAARVATGRVKFFDTSFEKISTKIYAGSIPPNVGSSVIKVSDASNFPGTGSIYIGRGTTNVEGPLAYTSVTPVGGYYEITLSSVTTKFHNISESVILAQGGVRNIPAGTTVMAPSTGDSPAISFNTTSPAVILDGETEITNVPISAQETGTDSNVPSNSITEIATTLFTGASVTNTSPVSNGRNEETDDELRERIKRARISRGLGTATAVKNSVLGAQASDENAVVSSNEIFSFGSDQTVLYVDDSTGYEEKSAGVGLEYIVDSALGGEQYFQLSTGGSQTSVAKAFLESNQDGPFDVAPTDRLALLVGGVLSEHVFQSGDFVSDGSATAYEIVSSINSNSDLLFSATTAGGGKRVVVSAKAEISEDIQATEPTSGRDASVNLYFQSNEIQTLRLYKNNNPLSKNGDVAQVESMNQSDWSNTILSGDTLIISVDGTDYITYTFTDANFLTEGTHSSVNKNNNISSWINVINAKITGVTASISGNRIKLQSNLGASSRASIEIDPSSTLVTKGMFTLANGLSSFGAEADFILSRNTAQFKLVNPLAPGDSLTAGTEFTKGYVSSTPILGGTLNLSSDAHLWVLVDNSDAEIISTGVVSDTLLSVSKPSANVVRYTSNASSAFVNVQVGDYVIIWSEELSSTNRLEGRVNAVTNTTLDLKVTPAEYAAAVVESSITFGEGFVVIRTDKTVQKAIIAAGSYNINTVALDLTDQLVGASVTVENDEVLNITTETQDIYGHILIVTFNDSGKSLNLLERDSSQSEFSQFAFYESMNEASNFPDFVHSTITDNNYANPPASTISSFNSNVNLTSLEVDPNNLVCMLHPYGGIEDNVSAKECVQIDSLSGLTVNIDDSQFIKRLRASDRFYVARPYDFGAEDSIVTILDSDPVNKSFIIPLYRKATTNTTMSVNANDFRAYDSDSGPSIEFSQFFGSTFSFKNFKVLMKSKNAINPKSNTVDEDSILFRCARWGLEGNYYNIGYIYPTSANNDISHSITVDEKVNIRISLKSGVPVVNSIDGTTEWDVTVTPNTPVAGVDSVTYTWNTVGTDPALNLLAPGHYVSINSSGEFSPENTGTFKVISSTATSFTVYRPNGVAIAESNIATLTISTISLYENSDTSAAEIVDYVTDNLFDYVTAELLDDNGLSGAGVIDESTYEDSDFSYEGIDLYDGINWILSSNLAAIAPNAQFTFKNALTLPSINTATVNAYTFNDGEEIRLVPTTAVQVDNLTSILAVTGFTTIGEITLSDRENKIQLGTQVLGSEGAIQVTGGTANSIEASIVNQASKIADTDLISVPILRSLSGGFHANQWVKVSAQNAQKKDTGISLNTSVRVYSNTPSVNKSIIELGNKEDHDNFFGLTRNFFRDRGRTFHVEKHGSLVCISWDGTSSSPVFNKTANINDGGGGFVSVDFDESLGITYYTVTSGNIRFFEVGKGDKLITSAFADEGNNGTFVVLGVSDDGLTVAVDNVNGVDATAISISPSDIIVTCEIQEGDSVTISSPFSTLNQGKFRVIRRYENSVYIENNSAIEESVTISDNLRSLGFDGTTQFDVTIEDGSMKLIWNGTGTEPNLENAKMGDILRVGTAFTANNQGYFSIVKTEESKPEIFEIECVGASDITTGQYFTLDLPNSGTSYYIWYNKDGGGGDPMPGGKTDATGGSGVVVTTGDSASTVATATAAAIAAIVGFSASSSSEVVTATADNNGSAVDAANVDVGGSFNITVTQQGTRTYIECANASVVAQSGISVTSSGSNVLEAHEPSISFSEYESTLPGDKIVISGNVLGEDNTGTYEVEEVLDRKRIIVNSGLTSIEATVLSNDFAQVYAEEESPYYGYKRTHSVVVDPSNSSRFLLIFDSQNQYLKISNIGDMLLNVMSKLEIPDSIKIGLDSYRYNTGLIAQSNKIVYGDPRDNLTYPGVAAAGAEIFIKPPLIRRIIVSINVRVNTGIPFNRVVEQVRSNIAALINSSPIGQSIAISDIVAAVNIIPGVFAVSISSPTYDVSNDVIVINPSEKPLVLDIVNDIIVTKQG